MELDVFKKFLHKYLKEKGFEKIKSKYYLKGEKFLCMIHFYRSYYGPTYYFDYYFFLGEFEKPYAINQESVETYTPYVGSRFYFTEKDKYSCDFLDYDEEKLKALLDKNFAERIIPPFEIGKKYLLDNYGTIYTTFLNFEKIIKLLGGAESDIQSIKALCESKKENMTYLMDRRCKIVIENGKKVLRECSIDYKTKYD